MTIRAARLEDELKHLIVTALSLEDVRASDIQPTEPLFVTGLGLDSIDALELAIAIEKRYGVRFSPDDAQNQRIFVSLRALAQHIERALSQLAPAPLEAR
jgi:acyl carrier protein